MFIKDGISPFKMLKWYYYSMQICDSVPSKSVSSYYMHVSRSLYVLPYSTFPFLQDGAEERDATSDSEATGWNLIDLAPRLIGLPIAKGFSVEIINGLKLEWLVQFESLVYSSYSILIGACCTVTMCLLAACALCVHRPYC